MSTAPTDSDMDATRQHRGHAGAVKSMGDMLIETPAPTEAARTQAAVPQATQAIPVHDLDGDPEFQIRKITVAEYHAMGEAGIFEPGERVELIDGLLIVPPPMGDAHWGAVARMQRRMTLALGERALVTSQLPVIVSDVSEPEPDVMLVRARDGFYGAEIPRTADVIAVVEASDSSLRFDRREKLAMYARAGIPEYWIANVRAKQIDIHRDPRGEAYTELRTAQPGETVAFAAFPDVVFTVDELLG